MSIHTTGPWHTDGDAVWRDDMRGICQTVEPPEGVNFAPLEDGRERHANARLIAAAPELLAVVKEWLEGEPGRIAFGVLVQRARAAVAAAEGQS